MRNFTHYLAAANDLLRLLLQLLRLLLQLLRLLLQLLLLLHMLLWRLLLLLLLLWHGHGDYLSSMHYGPLLAIIGDNSIVDRARSHGPDGDERHLLLLLVELRLLLLLLAV